jgi:hypothetical protein
MIPSGLIDIRDVRMIDTRQPLEQRALSFIRQIKNPYHFRYGKYEVMVDFVGEERLEDKLISYLSKK